MTEVRRSTGDESIKCSNGLKIPEMFSINTDNDCLLLAQNTDFQIFYRSFLLLVWPD